MNLKKQLFRLKLFGFFTCLRLTDAVWVVLLTARGCSLWQIGLAESVYHMVSLLGEIPSGVAADLLGRRRSMMAAGLCGAVSALLMAFGGGFAQVCLSMAFSALAGNFVSGSDEALLYDSLVQCGGEEDYLRAGGRYAQVQNLGATLSNAASLLYGVLGFVGFYLLDASVCLVRMMAAGSLTEPVVTQNQAARQEHPFRAIGQRLSTHIREVSAFLRGNPAAAKIMLADGVICLPGYLTLMFLQQRLSELGFSVMWLGLPVMAVSLSRLAGVWVAERLRPAGLRGFYALCALLVGAGTICTGCAPILPAVLGAMVASGSMDAWVLHQQRRLNAMFPSDRRATLVSVNMMAYSLLMIAASPAVGRLGDTMGSAGAGLCALGALVGGAGIFVLFLGK